MTSRPEKIEPAACAEAGRPTAVRRNYGDQFASYADARRVCAGAAENRGWVVERVGDANAIGSSRFVVPLRVRTVGHSNNSDRIDCVWDARENRVRFSQS